VFLKCLNIIKPLVLKTIPTIFAFKSSTMKYITIILSAIILTACGSPAEEENNEATDSTAVADPSTGNFGIEITADGAIAPSEFLAQLEGQQTMETKLSAKVLEVCQNKGCWMTVDLENGEEMRVTFKDYGFFVPMDCDGKQTIIQGVAFYDTVTVETLQHYATDAGEPQEVIDSITEPELQLGFEATGVIIN